ncbi:aminoacyl-tRNA hydrolase [Neopestalotiopsis sp. 37M]|nr:aminoacyl-tRNA hydrolase [Neopestalotiopsis sp. 37M]
MPPPRFLICSIGNPLPAYYSLHSAGHFALQSFQKLLAPSQPSWTQATRGGFECWESHSASYTLMQSPTLMNASGPWIANVWQEMLKRESLETPDLGLVVVHDELESPLGLTRLRSWNTSHKGHNGLKSTKAQLNKENYPGAKWWRISVGIDRPPSRDRDVVAEYVLRKMEDEQREIIEANAAPRILACLEKLQEDWKHSQARSDSLT